MTLLGLFLALTSITNFASSLPEDKRNNSDLSRILFPTTQKTESQEIPLELIRRLNMLSTIEEFFTNMVESEEMGLSARIGSGAPERSSLKVGRTGKCMPEYTTISLKPDQSTTMFYYPRCVRVKRCGGCCLHSLFSCRAIEKEFVPVMVAITEYRGGKQFRLKEKKIMQVEQHTKCECGCKIQPQDCTKYQSYNANNCRCECPNSEKDQKCFKKIWNPDICGCVCREEISCGTGFEFDPFTCSCLPSRGRRNSNFLYQLYLANPSPGLFKQRT